MSKFTPLNPLSAFDTRVLEGKSVIITGGGSGLGEAFAHEFVKAGAFVTIADINETNGKRVVNDLGRNSQFVKCDITVWAEQLAVFKAAIAKSPHNSCDIVCANAGIAGHDDLYNQDDTEEPKEPDLSIVKVHTIGTLYTTKLALHYFRKQPDTPERDRCLIITSSLAGYVGYTENPLYGMAKWGVRSLMRSLRETSGDDNTRINLIAPTFVATPLLLPEAVQYLESKNSEFATASDVAQAVIHIASDRTISGRGVAVVSRTMAEKGYFDIQDEPHTDFLTMAQGLTQDLRTR